MESGQKGVQIFWVSLGATPDSPSYPGEQAGLWAVLGDFGELRFSQTRQWTVRCQPQCPVSQWSLPGRADTPSLRRTGSRSCCHSGVRRGRAHCERELCRNWRGLRTTLCWGRNAEELESVHSATLQTCSSCFLKLQDTREGRDCQAAVLLAPSSGGWAGRWQVDFLFLSPG